MPRKSVRKRVFRSLGMLLVAYFAIAYVALPLAWTHHDRQPAIADLAMRTHTSQGIPGDPINLGAVGEKEALLRAFARAGWAPADPITLASSLEIAESVVLHRPDDTAPVSPLFFNGRKQDFAFEKQVGGSADKRHHVRLWRTNEPAREGGALWLGSATFDRGVGFSRYTGQITHHISPDLDAERDFVIDDLKRAGVVTEVYQISGSGPTPYGRNGEGDPYFTDGEVTIAVLRNAPSKEAAVSTPPPAYVARKRMLFDAYRKITHWIF